MVNFEDIDYFFLKLQFWDITLPPTVTRQLETVGQLIGGILSSE
jgi:hypothetical protein